MLDKVQVNTYGLLGLGLVATMIVLRMLLVAVPEGEATNPLLYRFITTILDPYILFSSIPYVIGSIIISQRLNSKVYTQRRLSTKDRFSLQNIFIGLQISMVLWILGMLLGLNNIVLQVVYYIAALAVGLVIPFLLFSRNDQSSKKDDEIGF